MMEFTIEEINLMCIYDTGTRQGLMEQSKLPPRKVEIRMPRGMI